jgi:hypothetical protein
LMLQRCVAQVRFEKVITNLYIHRLSLVTTVLVDGSD